MIESSELFNSIAVAEEFRFRPMPLSYMVPSLASLFEVLKSCVCLIVIDVAWMQLLISFVCPSNFSCPFSYYGLHRKNLALCQVMLEFEECTCNLNLLERHCRTLDNHCFHFPRKSEFWGSWSPPHCSETHYVWICCSCKFVDNNVCAVFIKERFHGWLKAISLEVFAIAKISVTIMTFCDNTELTWGTYFIGSSCIGVL